jgi:hypothetical protein
MIKSVLTVPALAGLNWIVTGRVSPGARENATGPPTRLKGEPLANCSTVPDSIPLPALRMFTVLLVEVPGAALSAILPGIESLPGNTIALNAIFTWGCFGSPLVTGILWVAVPSALGLKVIVIGMLDSGATLYWPAPVTSNGAIAVPTTSDIAEVRLRLRIRTVLDTAGIPIPVAGKRTADGAFSTPPGGSAIGVEVGVEVGIAVGVGPTVIVSVGVGSIVLVAVIVGVGGEVAVAVVVGVEMAVGVAVPVAVGVGVGLDAR